MNWKEYIENQKSNSFSFCFYDLATNAQIAESEGKIRIIFPDELKELYSQTDGAGIKLNEFPDMGIMDYLLFPLEYLVEYNLLFHKNWTAEKHLLFVAPHGNGDYYGYEVVYGEIVSTQIYKWDHEDDSSELYSNSLAEFIERVLNW